MAQRRIHMRKVKQVLRLSLKEGLSHRAISKSLRVGRQTVSEYLQRAKVAGLSSWEDIKGLSELELEEKLFPKTGVGGFSKRRVPSWQDIYNELKLYSNATLYLLWKEYYKEDPSSAYSYSQFCLLYRRWKGCLPLELRRNYKAGEVMFVDYAGQKIAYIDKQTGGELRAEVFVAVLGASNYIYSEAQESQKVSNWIQGHINAFEHIGGVVQKVVPDNLKSGVTKPSYYEPQINTLYDDLSLHYNFVVMPTRVRSPRDKGKVENAVQQVERWVLAPLRKRQFFSIEEINEAMRPFLEELNNKKMNHIDKSRKELLEEIERPGLKRLPEYTFEVSDRRTQKVGPNYHVTYQKHYYSVPYRLVGERVEIRATSKTVEIYHGGQRVASHLRDDTAGVYSTIESHMPQSHQAVKQQVSLEAILRQAKEIGPSVVEFTEKLYERRRHVEEASRSAIGVLRLTRHYSKEDIDSACRLAIEYDLISYNHVKNFLRSKMFKEGEKEPRAVSDHENLRGSGYYN